MDWWTIQVIIIPGTQMQNVNEEYCFFACLIQLQQEPTAKKKSEEFENLLPLDKAIQINFSN